MEIRLIIAGSRDFFDYNLVANEANLFIAAIRTGTPNAQISIVSGNAKGVDELGEQFAKDNNLEVIRIPAEWERHGRFAGPIRNKEMVKLGTHVLAFWDGKSKGTKSMINLATKKGLIVKVVSLK